MLTKKTNILTKSTNLFEEIGDINRAISKEHKAEAKRIYDESLDVLLSEMDPKEKHDNLAQYKQKIRLLLTNNE